MWISSTYGGLEIDQIPDKILDYYNRVKVFETPLQIIIGTDSQTTSSTKIVSVIAVICQGHGGIYFHENVVTRKIKNVADKLRHETMLSLEVIAQLSNLLESPKYNCFMKDVTLTIHVDASTNPCGKTQRLVPELVGWINACGYPCDIKPNSFVASSIADRLTK